MPLLNSHIDELIVKHLKGTISEEEQIALNNWLNSAEENKKLFENLNNEQWVSAELLSFQRYEEEKGWEKVKEALPVTEAIVVKKFNWARLAVAASVIGLLFLAGYWLLNTERKNAAVQPEIVVANDVEAPKGTKARITLANGQSVFLDSINSGTLAKQGNVNVVKTDDGQIIYNGSATELQYNTFSNPRGSSVATITLSDGTKVWLNSESSLTYPVAFTGKERRVEITGEAYFEVMYNATKPFYVTKNDVNVQVLGTHFNVNTYSGESGIKITLLEGSVRVLKANDFKLLKPGQQAQINNEIKIANAVDVEEVMAWKNGRFHFSNADINEWMKEISRWYDVDVNFISKPNMRFGGKIDRNSSLMQALKILEESGVRFKLEGRTLNVL